MKKLVNFAMTLVVCLFMAGISQAQMNDLITENSVGKLKLGMTVAEARKALSGMKFKRISDGDGVALIAVDQGKNTLMTIYAGEDDRDAPINENGIVEFIEVWSKDFHTAEGVHPDMKVSEVEKKYGKVKKIAISEIEAREFADFANQPKGINFRLMSEDGMAGDYKGGERRTTKYKPNAAIAAIQVQGIGLFEEESNPIENTEFPRTTKNANEEARNLADSGYEKNAVQSDQIKFANGAYTAQAKGTFRNRDEKVIFTVKAEKDQRMIVNIRGITDGLGTAGVIFSPSGEQDGQPGGLVFNSVLKETGDYKIRVSQRPTDHTFPADFVVEVILIPQFLDNEIKNEQTDVSYKPIDFTDFNKQIDNASTANEIWTKMPDQVIAKIIPQFSEIRSRTIEMVSPSAEDSDSLTVVVTDDGFLDDSIRGEKHKFELKMNAQGVWKVASAGKAWRCWENRGHQDYSTQPCL
jgi:hypothetical protein